MTNLLWRSSQIFLLKDWHQLNRDFATRNMARPRPSDARQPPIRSADVLDRSNVADAKRCDYSGPASTTGVAADRNVRAPSRSSSCSIYDRAKCRKVMQTSKFTPHLDPLPSSDEGRGNQLTPFGHASAWVTERDQVFPLPFTRGEDQGEGLLRRPFVSLTKWRWGQGEVECEFQLNCPA